jgi:hypothetical protein
MLINRMNLCYMLITKYGNLDIFLPIDYVYFYHII